MLRGGRRALPLLARLATGAVPQELAAIACAPQAAPLQSVSQVPRTRLASTYGGELSNRTIWPETEVFVGQPAPDFTAAAVVDGDISQVSLSDYKGKYVVLFFYPKDFTFVCPTEIIAFSDRAKDFEACNTQLIAASTDTEETHLAWLKTPRNRGGLGHLNIPIIADTTKDIASRYGVLIEDLGIALRGLFIINPEGIVEQITINNLPIGRNVDEALRLVQAIQFVAEHGEVCPANWQPGSKTMKANATESLEYFGSVEDASDEVDFGQSLRALKTPEEYLQATTSSDRPVVVDFYAPWCGKCRQLAPHVEALQEKFPGVDFYKVDTTSDAMKTLVGPAELDVKALPAFKFFKHGKIAEGDLTGYKKKLLEDTVASLVRAA